MSNIRPISDPSLATAMLATMQSVDAARSAPAGISSPRWRILQCIAKAAPNVPSQPELVMCSGLNKAALAEHVQALQWKGLIEMGGYRLSPTAAEMVGVDQLYPPKDAKEMKFADPAIAIRGRSGTFIIDEFASFDVPAPELPLADIGPLPLAKTAPLDPADVPACMRPDCTPPVEPIPAPQPQETNKHGRGSAAVARPHQGAEPCDPVAADCISELSQVRILPPANPPKSSNWIADRFQRIAAATAFLKSQGILVTVVDRDAPIREYFVSGKRYRQLAEEVVEIAIAKGWVE